MIFWIELLLMFALPGRLLPDNFCFTAHRFLNGPGVQSRRPCYGSSVRKVEILPPIGGTRVAGRVGRVTVVEEAETDSAGVDVQVNMDIMDARDVPAASHEDALVSVPNTADTADMEADEDTQHDSTDCMQECIHPRMSCNAMIVMCCAAGMVTGGPHDTNAKRVSALFIVNKWGFKRSRTLSGSHRTQIIMHTCATCWDACLILVREHMCARSCLQCRWEYSPRLRASRRFKSG